MNIVHHFAGGAYAKESHFTAGEAFAQHAHPHAHLAILAQGVAIVHQFGRMKRVEAPACLTLAANVTHSVEAVTDVVWFCVWATDDTDPTTVDATILKGG